MMGRDFDVGVLGDQVAVLSAARASSVMENDRAPVRETPSI